MRTKSREKEDDCSSQTSLGAGSHLEVSAMHVWGSLIEEIEKIESRSHLVARMSGWIGGAKQVKV